METVGFFYRKICHELAPVAESQSDLEAEWLFCFVLNCSRSQFFLRFSDLLVPDVQLNLEALVAQRLTGKPLAYILGSVSFMGRVFQVKEGVLIPRPETERLVEESASRLRQILGDRPFIGFECGCGTGVISLSLASLFLQSRWVAWDINAAAIACSIQNARQLDLVDRVTFIEADFFEGLSQQPQGDDYKEVMIQDLPLVFVSNPPYISSFDCTQLDASVTSFEPLSALDGGVDGLDFYRKFKTFMSTFKPIFSAFELGQFQFPAVQAIFQDMGHTEAYLDYQGIQRGIMVSQQSHDFKS